MRNRLRWLILRDRLARFGLGGAVLTLCVASFAVVLADGPVPVGTVEGRFLRMQYADGRNPAPLWYVETAPGSAHTIRAPLALAPEPGAPVCLLVERSRLLGRTTARYLNAGAGP